MALQFDTIDKTSQGEYSVTITTQDGGPVFHQLNNVYLTVDTEQGEAQLKGDLSSLDQFNKSILEYANEHSEDWFGRKVSRGYTGESVPGSRTTTPFLPTFAKILKVLWSRDITVRTRNSGNRVNLHRRTYMPMLS